MNNLWQNTVVKVDWRMLPYTEIEESLEQVLCPLALYSSLFIISAHAHIKLG